MKAFICRTCKRKFSLWASLDKHIKAHEGHEGIDATFFGYHAEEEY